MSKLIFALLIFCALVSGCTKTNTSDVGYGLSKNYSGVNNASANGGGAFSFTKITVAPNPIKIGAASKLIATATGNNLVYKWSTSHGDLFGTGAAIYYSDSCIGEYSITCVVSDGTHSATITIPISVSN